jgi:hypothetical protein
VLAWRLSNTLSSDFCTAALQEAQVRYGTPEIFYTDLGSQFTSLEFTVVLKAHQIEISVDGHRHCPVAVTPASRNHYIFLVGHFPWGVRCGHAQAISRMHKLETGYDDSRSP